MASNPKASSDIDPPSFEANNNDLLVWSLFLLGGAEKWVDVEDIYLKAFELGPARLSWRTRADIPDYKKVSKALQSVEAGGNRWQQLLEKRGAYDLKVVFGISSCLKRGNTIRWEKGSRGRRERTLPTLASRPSARVT